MKLIESVRKYAMKQAIPENFFEPEIAKGNLFEKIADRVYAFRHNIDRALILDTGDGLAVIDTFNHVFTKELKNALSANFKQPQVRWLFYSHYHLDHVLGGKILAPQEIIAHEKCLVYWQDFDTSDLLMPTKTISGDRTFKLGAVELQLFYLGLSHTDTLYAFYLPEQRVLYSPDVGFVKTLPPFGLPDFYHPGYIRALDLLSKLDFDLFIPSHFERGTKADFIAFRNMMVDFRDTTEQSLKKRGGIPTSGKMVKEIFDEVYVAMEKKYGQWHGFSAMFIPTFVRQLGGVFLGH